MSLLSVQCPNCGSPVEAGAPGTLMRCPACASVLEVKTGSSGYPLATLASIGQDTSFLAKREAAKRLQEHVARLADEQERLRDEIRAAGQHGDPHSANRKSSFGGIALVVLLLMLSSGLGVEVAVAVAVVTVVSLALFRFVLDEFDKRSVRERCAPRLAEIDAEIETRQVRRARLEAELDQLTHQF